MRRPVRWIVSMGLILSLGLGGRVCMGQEAVSPRVDSALIRGLEYLATQQQNDGSFEPHGPKVAVTALCVMAFMASGHVQGDGRYGQTVRRGVDYLIEQFPEDGYVGKVDHSRMYGQGIATLTLAEAYGVERDGVRRQKIRQILTKAVDVIVAAQDVKKDENNAGGWRYEPGSADSDLSLSGWNALALRSCNNIGISVKKECVDRATAYVMKCYRANEKGFAYQPWGQATPGMTGVGVLNLCLMDKAKSLEVAAGATFMAEHAVTEDTRFAYYSFYYVTYASFQVGEPTWGKVWKMSSEKLVGMQQDDGGWPQSRSGEEPGRTYATAMAVLALSAPNRILPVHQR